MAPKFWLIAVAGCLLFASCTAGSEGIFASISRQEKIVSLSGISSAATVTNLVDFGSYYYATGGAALFSKLTSPAITLWHSSKVGGNQNVTSVAVAGTAGTNQALFAAANGVLWESDDGSTWNDVTSQLGLTTTSSVNMIVPVRNIDGYTSDRFIVISSVPVSAASNSTLPNYNQISLITGSTTVVDHITNVSTITIQQVGPIKMTATGAQTNSDGSQNFGSAIQTAVKTTSGEYYVASEGYLWNLDTNFANLALITNSINYNGAIEGLLAFRATLDTQDQLFLTTGSNNGTGGGFYRAIAPTGTSVTFTPIVTNEVDANSGAMTLTSMMYCPDNKSLWIGTGPVVSTQGDGYAEYAMTTIASGVQGQFSTTPNTNSDNYTSTVLPTSAVGCFYVNTSTSPTTYFMGMSAEGLWAWAPLTKNWVQQ